MYEAEGKKGISISHFRSIPHAIVLFHNSVLDGLLPTQNLKPLRKQASESGILGI